MIYNGSKEFLSELIIYSKYAKFVPVLGRRENWQELIQRNVNMHIEKYPHLEQEIYNVYGRSVLPKKVLPSMRSLQFGGVPIMKNPARIYNCAARAMDDTASFSELMFLLLGGSGVGISVQKHHIDKLNTVKSPTTDYHRRFFIQDSIMGWADSIKALMRSYFEGRPYIDFDPSEVRKKGEPLKTAGGTAPGPEPLMECIANIRKVMDTAIKERGEGTKLTTIEVHDIACFISKAVLSGGLRRAAIISVFSHDDELMLNAKTNFHVELLSPIEKINENCYKLFVNYRNNTKEIFIDEKELHQFNETKTIPWHHFEGQRGYANNSMILLRGSVSEEFFKNLMKRVERSHAGEPGILWTSDLEMFFNPCAEITLYSKGFCNLVEICADEIENEEDFFIHIKDGTFIATIQAGYTDFHYLSHEWRVNAERDALCGVSFTGIASGQIFNYDLVAGAKVALAENERVAKLIGINIAKRLGTVKPSGTTSLVLGTASGVHAWFDHYYFRIFDIMKDKPLYKYALEHLGSEFVMDNYYSPDTTAVIGIPIKAPDGAAIRTEHPQVTLERAKRLQMEWIRNTHREGVNYNNVSLTVNVKPDEWGMITDWMWDNRDYYSGISLIDYDGGTYPQMPHTTISETEYYRLEALLAERVPNFVIEDIFETYDDLIKINHNIDNVACSGGSCEISHI